MGLAFDAVPSRDAVVERVLFLFNLGNVVGQFDQLLRRIATGHHQLDQLCHLLHREHPGVDGSHHLVEDEQVVLLHLPACLLKQLLLNLGGVPSDALAEATYFTCLRVLSEAEGKLPLKVTHNDTEMSNVLIDNATGDAVCVIDLDTVMPGPCGV